MLYTSLTGNIEIMAKEMINELKERNNEMIVKEFNDDSINVEMLLKYDIIFIGIYTWSAGDVPLEVEDFYDDLYNVNLKGKICGVFGSADSAYNKYGTAVEMMYEQLESCGAKMVPDKLIVDLEPTSTELKCCKKLVNTAFNLINV